MAGGILKQKISFGAPILQCDRRIGADRSRPQLCGTKCREDAVLVGRPKWRSGAATLVLIVLLTSDKKVMGKRANAPGAQALGWICAAVMSVAALALLVLLAKVDH
jgi:hypothetical protein